MGILSLMKSAAKKQKNLLDIDGRGRITLPKELRDGVDAFSIEQMKDGALRLVPQQVVSSDDAKLLASLKRSAADLKAGRVSKISQTWLDNDDEKL